MSEYMTGPSWGEVEVPETPSPDVGDGSDGEWLTTPVLVGSVALVGLLALLVYMERSSDGTGDEESQDDEEDTDGTEPTENDPDGLWDGSNNNNNGLVS